MHLFNVLRKGPFCLRKRRKALASLQWGAARKKKAVAVITGEEKKKSGRGKEIFFLCFTFFRIGETRLISECGDSMKTSGVTASQK